VTVIAIATVTAAHHPHHHHPHHHLPHHHLPHHHLPHHHLPHRQERLNLHGSEITYFRFLYFVNYK